MSNDWNLGMIESHADHLAYHAKRIEMCAGRLTHEPFLTRAETSLATARQELEAALAKVEEAEKVFHRPAVAA